MNIALFGGSFNPIHLGHIKLIKEIKEQFDIDKIILMPTAVSPHKSNSEMVSGEHRLKMCKLACENLDYVEVSDLEINRQGKSYTYLTIEDLKALYPNDNLHLIIGADMFMSFDTWKNFEFILRNVSLIGVPRDDVDNETMVRQAEYLESFGTTCLLLKDSVMDVSSTEIRNNIRNNISITDLIDAKVLNYIVKNKIYGCENLE